MRSSRFKSFEKNESLDCFHILKQQGDPHHPHFKQPVLPTFQVSASLCESLRICLSLCEPQILNFVTLLWNHSQNCYFWQKFGSKVGNTENKGSILSGWNFFLFVVFCAICSLVCHTRSSIFAWPAKLGTCFKHKDTNHILLLFNE